MTDAEFIGSRWVEVNSGRPVVVLRYGGNGAWFRYEDDGSEWHCFVEDWFIWGRFRRADA
jgi:hypothetical protein